jgi:hypothetical protein
VSEKVEGTFLLDGLLEGRLPDIPDAEACLRKWIDFAAGRQLHFGLEIEGGTFNILADKRPIRADDLGPEPAEALAEALRDFMRVFPPGQPTGVFSTLRSVEYRPGLEVQTLYVIAPTGDVQTRQRAVDARTTQPPEPLTRGAKAKIAVAGVLIAALVFLISAVFVDYRALWHRIVESSTPFDPDKLVVEMDGFQPYFAVEKKALGRNGKAAVLTLKRAEAFPKSDADCERLLAASGGSLSKRLTAEALARGYVRCELFGKDAEFLGFCVQRVARLREKETTELVIPLPREQRLVRVVITY